MCERWLQGQLDTNDGKNSFSKNYYTLHYANKVELMP